MGRAGGLCCVSKNQMVKEAKESLKAINPERLLFGMERLGPH